MHKVNLSSLMIIIMAIVLPPAAAKTFDGVEKKVKQVEAALAAHIGVAILETKNHDIWSYKGGQRVPLMSTFKTFACAKLLKDVEAGNSNLDSTVKLEKQLLVSYSPVTEQHIGEHFSVGEACTATMLTSDNTAANIVLEKIGGPLTLTQFMRDIGDSVTRLDRIETALNEATPGDLRDTTTPNAMVKSLHQILFAKALSRQSKQQVKQWMIDATTGDSLLRSVLPDDWTIGDRTGAGGYGSRAITAVVWPADQPAIIIAVYITQTEASFKRRNDAIMEIGREIFKYFGQ